MMDDAAFSDIVSVYVKHGWTLRRVLLCAETLSKLSGTLESSYPNIPVIESDVDAAWFSRLRSDGPTAWEIRLMSTSPYALVTQIDGERESGDEFDLLESKLKAAAGRLPAAH